MLPRFALISAVALISITALLFTLRVYRHSDVPNTTWSPEIDLSPTNVTLNQSDWLTTLNLKYPIRYACRKVTVRANDKSSRVSLTKINSPLFESFEVIDSGAHFDHTSPRCSEPLFLDVPAFAKSPVDASHILFGIQTTIKRLNDSVPQLLRWLPNTGAKLYVVLIESEEAAADPAQMSDLQSQMRSLGLDVTLLPAEKDDVFPQRYFSLINIMYRNRRPETQWITLIDDDTFFPSMRALLSMLAEHDAKEEHYIGSLSEDWWAVSHYGLMGFGGAGLFLSIPLAKIMDANTHDCKEKLSSSAGDITVMDCVYRHTTTKLTHVPGLHQVDVHGDASGFYESGRLYLSLHHWKTGSVSGEGYKMDKMHLVADVCGDCFLQRWQFGDDMVLTNGFSIAEYRKGQLKGESGDQLDMNKMEVTWDVEQNVRHSLGPTRPRLVLGEEKVQYGFLDAMSSDGWVRQLYLHKGDSGESDTVLQLFWRNNEAG
ncbi:hypothetical protein MMC24_004426 [Lignoscripta atroalba]|nr:hypothetical protein [Lignoscripta atroalba]